MSMPNGTDNPAVTTPVVRMWESRYTLTAATSEVDSADSYLFEIEIERAPQSDGSVKWAVRWRGSCLHRSCRWDWEPIPSSRTDRWLKSHRFDFETAVRLATKAAPLLVVNGYRPDGSLARRVPRG